MPTRTPYGLARSAALALLLAVACAGPALAQLDDPFDLQRAWFEEAVGFEPMRLAWIPPDAQLDSSVHAYEDAPGVWETLERLAFAYTAGSRTLARGEDYGFGDYDSLRARVGVGGAGGDSVWVDAWGSSFHFDRGERVDYRDIARGYRHTGPGGRLDSADLRRRTTWTTGDTSRETRLTRLVYGPAGPTGALSHYNFEGSSYSDAYELDYDGSGELIAYRGGGLNDDGGLDVELTVAVDRPEPMITRYAVDDDGERYVATSYLGPDGTVDSLVVVGDDEGTPYRWAYRRTDDATRAGYRAYDVLADGERERLQLYFSPASSAARPQPPATPGRLVAALPVGPGDPVRLTGLPPGLPTELLLTDALGRRVLHLGAATTTWAGTWPPLPPGVYRLSAHAPGHAPRTWTLSAH